MDRIKFEKLIKEKQTLVDYMEQSRGKLTLKSASNLTARIEQIDRAIKKFSKNRLLARSTKFHTASQRIFRVATQVCRLNLAVTDIMRHYRRCPDRHFFIALDLHLNEDRWCSSGHAHILRFILVPRADPIIKQELGP